MPVNGSTPDTSLLATSIDWTKEYSRERERVRQLRAGADSLPGRLRLLLDGSQTWLVLIATGISIGLLAGAIDIVSSWLSDLRTGYCSSSSRVHRFYLNKTFCCWGFDDASQCLDWLPWSGALQAHASYGAWLLGLMTYTTSSTMFATSAAVLVCTYAVYAKHSGIPEIKIILGGLTIRSFMSHWTLLIKCLSLCLAVASGLWIGKEGPLVHIACSCASEYLKAFPSLDNNEAKKRELLSAAAAAGISVAFGSPIGGVLFSLEQLSSYFPDKTMWQSFVCAMIAAVTLQAYNPFRTGKLVLYQVRYHTTWREFEILPFVFLGVLGGLYGSVLIRLNMLYARLRERWRIARYPVVEVIAVTLLTSLIAFPSRLLRTQSSELLYNLFADCADLADDNLGLCSAQTRSIALILLLLAASLVGCLLTSVTFGLHLPAGVILPAMVIGALYGRVVGLVMQAWQQAFPALLLFRSCATDGACVTPGTYAIIGAASCLGGTTRMTISTVVIMFELTGALTYVLPIMVAVMISKWVGDACTGRGIFESWIDHLALPFLDSRDGSTAVPDLSVDHVMTLAANMAVLTASGHSVQSVIDLLNANRYAGYPVLASPTDAALLGYISRDALIGALEETSLAHPQSHLGSQVYFQRPSYPSAAPVVDLTAYVDTAPVALSPAVSLRFAMNLVQQLGLQKVLLTEKGLLKGIITRKDVWYALKMANS